MKRESSFAGTESKNSRPEQKRDSPPTRPQFRIAFDLPLAHNPAMQYLYAAVIGLLGGAASGLFGIGGGIVMVPAMIFLMKQDPRIAVGTSLAVIVPTALVGSFRHYSFDNIDWRIALMLAPTALIGGWIGPQIAEAISSLALKRAFAVLLLVAGVKLLAGK